VRRWKGIWRGRDTWRQGSRRASAANMKRKRQVILGSPGVGLWGLGLLVLLVHKNCRMRLHGIQLFPRSFERRETEKKASWVLKAKRRYEARSGRMTGKKPQIVTREAGLTAKKDMVRHLTLSCAKPNQVSNLRRDIDFAWSEGQTPGIGREIGKFT